MAGCLPPPFKFCMLHILVHNLAAYMHDLPHSTESMLLASYILDCAFSLTSLPNNCIYGGTSLLWTPSGPHEVSLIKEVSLFQRLFCALLYVAGTTGSVLNSEVLIKQRGSTVFESKWHLLVESDGDQNYLRSCIHVASSCRAACTLFCLQGSGRVTAEAFMIRNEKNMLFHTPQARKPIMSHCFIMSCLCLMP